MFSPYLTFNYRNETRCAPKDYCDSRFTLRRIKILRKISAVGSSESDTDAKSGVLVIKEILPVALGIKQHIVGEYAIGGACRQVFRCFCVNDADAFHSIEWRFAAFIRMAEVVVLHHIDAMGSRGGSC